MIWNVHKARSVFAPRSVVLVNSPRPERLRELSSVGGATRALDWVLDGMVERTPTITRGVSRSTFLADLVDNKGFERGLAEQMADVAESQGALLDDGTAEDLEQLGAERRKDAEHEAVDLGMAVAEARITVADLIDGDPNPTMLRLYADAYPAAFERTGLETIDLVDKFPVLNGVYGFVRGGGEPGENRLVPYRSPRGAYRIYADQTETEALLFRLDAVRLSDWLRSRGHGDGAPSPTTKREARLATLRSSESAAVNHEGRTAEQDLRIVVHSMAHRVIRQAAVAAGIDRDALSEYILPLHGAFFVYAQAGGGFVLGGLQAVFESELDRLVNSVVDAEHRCPLDPGCSRGSGACLGCLHLGEPSCRNFNVELDRKSLFGVTGYLAER